MGAIDTLIERSCIRTPGNGATAVTVNDAAVHALGTLQAGKIYGLRILAATDGEIVVGHYRSDGVDPDGNDCPITGGDPEHVVIPAGATEFNIIRDTTVTNSFVAYLAPLNGGTIT